MIPGKKWAQYSVVGARGQKEDSFSSLSLSLSLWGGREWDVKMQMDFFFSIPHSLRARLNFYSQVLSARKEGTQQLRSKGTIRNEINIGLICNNLRLATIWELGLGTELIFHSLELFVRFQIFVAQASEPEHRPYAAHGLIGPGTFDLNPARFGQDLRQNSL